MITALWLLAVQGFIGAFGTLYFHEYRAKLPAGGPRTRTELRLHAARSLSYALLFTCLPSVAPHGAWALVFAVLRTSTSGVSAVDAGSPGPSLPLGLGELNEVDGIVSSAAEPVDDSSPLPHAEKAAPTPSVQIKR
jgi:hypothetical protein